MSTIAFDVDFHRIHAFSTAHGRVCYKAPDWHPYADIIASHDTVLMEVFSPIFYDSEKIPKKQQKAILVNKMKMALFNARICGELYNWLKTTNVKQFLVSPSSAWTLKYPEEMRHDVAGVTGEDNHDIRECRAMLFFFGRNPNKWQPVEKYYEDYAVA